MFKKKKKVFRCHVCGTEMDLKKENKRVIIEDNGLKGVLKDIRKYEYFDCPKCGCQNIANIRVG